MMTAEEIADKAGIGVATLCRIQKGTPPRMATIKAIANAFSFVIQKDDRGFFFLIKDDLISENHYRAEPPKNVMATPRMKYKVDFIFYPFWQV